ncbi:hypothetical protein ACFL0R_06970 [Pseudomonadota bacterium]
MNKWNEICYKVIMQNPEQLVIGVCFILFGNISFVAWVAKHHGFKGIQFWNPMVLVPLQWQYLTQGPGFLHFIVIIAVSAAIAVAFGEHVQLHAWVCKSG